jgi:hypothetical protein
VDRLEAFICARAGVCLIGIQRGFGEAADLALFQPTVTTLAIPLAEFANPDKAIAAIKAKVAQSGFRGGRRVTRRQRALACAVGIIPVSIAGLLLMRCGCRWQSWILEIATAALYFLWVAT